MKDLTTEEVQMVKRAVAQGDVKFACDFLFEFANSHLGRLYTGSHPNYREAINGHGPAERNPFVGWLLSAEGQNYIQSKHIARKTKP